MSAQPAAPNTPPDHVSIEIDGKALQVPKGSMIIHAADKAGIQIPRFCYHDKLPIAANCRMCLVDVEKAPKPMPACATPVMDGMKVYTQSKRALDSQRNVMEFLLINHPLDCPICDQGGECELQDVAMGYGRSVSRFVERKRVVADEDLGPLVATDMTRCIHCTRCVRFTSEIAGTYELGGMGRGEHLEIGTYIGKAMESELSGNVVDVCPVGALTNKVFRFRARAWELIARESIGYHDALGSNLWLHTRRGEVLRTVPRDNEQVNECWLSDRDRYSHQGLYADDRVAKPLVRRDGRLVEAGWEEAIAAAAAGLKAAGANLGALVSPLASCEEGHLLAALLRGLGSEAIDHRLRVLDFADGAAGATFEMPLAALEGARAALLVGLDPRHDAPLLGHRLRKAARRGAAVHAINPLAYDGNFELAGERVVPPAQMVDELAAVARVLVDGGAEAPVALAEAIAGAKPGDAHRAIVDALRAAQPAVVLFGDFAVQHPLASWLRALARFVATATGAAFDELAGPANSVGLSRVGALPGASGHDAGAIMQRPRKALVVFQAGALDAARPAAFDRAREAAGFHLHIGAFGCAGVQAHADVVLPIGLPPETDGTYVNVDGLVQRFAAGAKAPGDARPGWRVLRALGAALGLPGFAFDDLAGLRAAMPDPAAPRSAQAAGLAVRRPSVEGLARIATVPVYRIDPVLRRAAALQASPLTPKPVLRLHPGEAQARGFAGGTLLRVSDGSAEVVLPLEISDRVPHGAVHVPAGFHETVALAPTGAVLSLVRA
ncbi:MAG: NADH-quinone oxidoreductase subunit NuoG [Xanthomonadaceae bacterium]|jgi:NADH-quinone oxidoreductase subunit G|nr:NADH-quinone oxidoreductase subunit NuoG [Xanthomonadaceae bacterium]